MNQPDITYLDDESFLTLDQITFKGVVIKPPSYARRACILSLVDLGNPQIIDVAGFLYGCICSEAEILAAKRNLPRWDKAVCDWINRVEYSETDSKEALEAVSAILAQTEKNKTIAVKPRSENDNLDFTPDPNG
jgi:hypothetical protein